MLTLFHRPPSGGPLTMFEPLKNIILTDRQGRQGLEHVSYTT